MQRRFCSQAYFRSACAQQGHATLCSQVKLNVEPLGAGRKGMPLPVMSNKIGDTLDDTFFLLVMEERDFDRCTT